MPQSSLRLFLRLVLFLCFSFGLYYSQTAQAEFDIYLKEPNKIPLYAQETTYWCGAGVGQMVLEGFPDDVNYRYAQQAVWNEIQKHEGESGWYSDPDGLKGALTQLGTESHWAASCAKTRASMTRLVVDGMYLSKYPVPVLVYGHDHWVVVIGATTEEHPMMSMTLTLKTIEAHDPWKAQHVLIDGYTWLNKYWKETGSSGKWRNCYVAVHQVETPVRAALGETQIITETHPNEGSVISPEVALDKAKLYLVQFTENRASFRTLSRGVLFDPILVTHAQGDYYLVPIGDKENGLSLGALMVNAYSGQWEGLSKFHEPLRYRTHREKGHWIFRPSKESPSPFHPAYQTARAFIDLDGKTSTALQPMGRGN